MSEISSSVRQGRVIAALLLSITASIAWAQSSPAPYKTGMRYDGGRRLVGIISPDPDGSGPLPFLAVRNSYDSAGRLIEVERGYVAAWQDETVAPANWSGFSVTNTLFTTYDADNHKLTDETVGSDGFSTLTQYSYDAVSRLQCTAERMNAAAFGSLPDACTLGPQGSQGPDRITHHVYDAAGQVLKVQKAYATPLQQDYATYSYTPNGRQASVTDANGNLMALALDGFDRLAQWTFPSPTAVGQVNAGDYEAYTYDANGNRTTLRKRDGVTIAYGYDALDRLVSKAVPASASGAAGYTVSYGYDLRNLQTSALFANGQGTTNSYDGFGELVSTTSTMGGISRTVSHGYDDDGNETSITHPDGQVFTYQYDGLDRLVTLVEGTSVASAGWSYDATGQLAGATDRFGGSVAYGHDPIGRLTSQADSYPGSTGTVTVGLAYNPASQIMSETRDNDAYAWTGAVSVNRSYAVNGLNQYTSAGPAVFAYDANGNLTSDGTNTYVYDAENRLVSASNGAQLAYDPLGRLWQTSGTATGTTQLLYDRDALVMEYDGSGNQLRRYVHGSGTDEPVLWYEGGTWVRSYHRDHQGSITGIAVGPGGGLLAINTYDEYGIPGANNTGRFGYTGQAWLPELGMWYYKARLYSPTLGRFMQTDPVGYRDQIDLYAYVANDPVNGTDPTGMWLWPWEKPVYVQGGSPSQRKRVEEAVGKVLATDRGKELEQEIRGGWIFHGDPVTIIIGHDPDGTNTPKDGDGDPSDTIHFDPTDRPGIITADGPKLPSVERIVGHELGHAADKAEDDGPDQMNNVNKNENPIARGLGLSPRTQYDTAPPQVKAAPEVPKCPQGNSCD